MARPRSIVLEAARWPFAFERQLTELFACALEASGWLACRVGNRVGANVPLNPDGVVVEAIKTEQVRGTGRTDLEIRLEVPGKGGATRLCLEVKIKAQFQPRQLERYAEGLPHAVLAVVAPKERSAEVFNTHPHVPFLAWQDVAALVDERLSAADASAKENVWLREFHTYLRRIRLVDEKLDPTAEAERRRQRLCGLQLLADASESETQPLMHSNGETKLGWTAWPPEAGPGYPELRLFDVHELASAWWAVGDEPVFLAAMLYQGADRSPVLTAVADEVGCIEWSGLGRLWLGQTEPISSFSSGVQLKAWADAQVREVNDAVRRRSPTKEQCARGREQG